MLEKAIELDPKYADAYALLGYTYWLTDFYAWTNDRQALEHAFELAKQSIALDDSAALGHNLMSSVEASKLNYDQAIAEVRRAIALDPNYAGSYIALGHALMFSGRPEEAIDAQEKGLRLDPRNHFYIGELGTAYVFMGRYMEAIPLLKQALVTFPDELGPLRPSDCL
jgi:adenylate cyclase